MNWSPYPKELRNKIIAEILDRKSSLYAAVKKYKITRETLQRWVNSHCRENKIEYVPYRKNIPYTLEFKDRLCERILAGEKISTLSREYDIGHQVIRQWANQYRRRNAKREKEILG